MDYEYVFFGNHTWRYSDVHSISFHLPSIIILWLLNIAMENGPFIDGLPIKKWGCSMAMLNNQMVALLKRDYR
jgi:hypothetical protein